MDRRTLIGATTACLVVLPLAARSQTPQSMPRIGWLGAPSRESADAVVKYFVQGLNDLGWIEGRNIAIEWRFAGGKPELLRDLAAELVKLRVALIVVPSTPPAMAAKNATTSIPIVTVSVGDPVALGLVKSLARPDGNLTGLTSSVDPKMAGKLVALMKESFPKANEMAVLWNPNTPGNIRAVREAEMAANSLGLTLQILEARSPGDLDQAFAAMSARRSGALLVQGDVMFFTYRARITELAARSGIPAIYGSREFPDEGGLMSYGPVLPDLFRRAATYVDRILKGAKPSELPMEQPTKFELVINLKAARALGFTVPQPVLLRADDVIQ